MTTLEITPEQVSTQLSRILASEPFSSSQTLSDFLRYIVTETINGRGGQVKEYTVAVNALFKKGFDPQTDASVRVHAGRLRKYLASYYEKAGVEDQVLISLPKGAYIPVFGPFDPNDRMASGASFIPQKPSIAVIPFSTANPDLHASIAEGICHQLSTDLTTFNEISVVSYYSSRQLAAKEDNLRKLGLMLDASYIITGHVQDTKDRIRIGVQLSAAGKMQQIWAETYEKKWEDVDLFSIQDDIVKHVINQVAGTHGSVVRDLVKIPDHRRLLDLKVYDVVFWYYYLVNELNNEVFQKAIQSIKAANDIDPRYALGWAILGEAYVAGYFTGFETGVKDPLRESIRCGTTALKLDVRCHHAYQALALGYLFQHNREECVRTAENWLALNANVATTAGGLGFCLICCGEFEKGYTMLDESIRLNPFYQWWFNAGLSIYYYHLGEWDEAAYWAEKMQYGSPLWTAILACAARSRAGARAEAEDLRRQIRDLVPDEKLPEIICSFILHKPLCDSLREAVTGVEIRS